MEEIPAFWDALWHYFDIIASKPYEAVVDDLSKFPGARLNYAENMLRYMDEPGEAITFRGEDFCFSLGDRVTGGRFFCHACGDKRTVPLSQYDMAEIMIINPAIVFSLRIVFRRDIIYNYFANLRKERKPVINREVIR